MEKFKYFISIVLVSLIVFDCSPQVTQLWGMTVEGGQYNAGTIFNIDSSGNNHVVQHNFFMNEGAYPERNQLIQAIDGKLYGLTTSGGINDLGVIFQYDPLTSSYIKKFDFNGAISGNSPSGSLLQASDGMLYGMTMSGGINGFGVLFQYNPATATFTKKFDFSGIGNGSNPTGSLMQASNGRLYGVTRLGGANNRGVLFEYDPTTAICTKKIDFDGALNGGYPEGSLIQASDGILYGTASGGGTNGFGIIFQYNPTTSVCTKKIDFTGIANGNSPTPSLMQANDGMLYGMTSSGGINNFGVLFQYDPITNVCVKKIDFSGTVNGKLPKGALTQGINGELYGMTSQGGIYNAGVLFQYNPATNSYLKKIDFDGALNGSNPLGNLLLANDGKLYGMTYYGGTAGVGVLFQYDITLNNYIKKIDFNGAIEGSKPVGGLLQANDGNFYGMTYNGGINGMGAIFQYDPLTSIYTKKLDFAGAINGQWPDNCLMQASDGMLYGVTPFGGSAFSGVNSLGVLFQYNPLTSTYIKKIDFMGASNGRNPSGPLIQANDGMIYGMTSGGGINGGGVLFQYNPFTSSYIKKIEFSGITDGSAPRGSLIQGVDGKLYGMTSQGGINNLGVLFQYDPLTSVYNKLLDFEGIGGIIDGSGPYGSLLQASDGKLYGVTYSGGINDLGVLFQYDIITSTYSKKIDFLGQSNGSNPWASLIQASNGKIYGTTSLGGIYNKGTVFQFDIATNTLTKKIEFNGVNGKNPGNINLIEVTIPNVKIQSKTKLDKPYTIYPNPATNGFTIFSDKNIGGPVCIEIINTLGQIVYTAKLTDLSNAYFINTVEWDNGSYYIKIYSSELQTVTKFIKQ